MVKAVSGFYKNLNYKGPTRGLQWMKAFILTDWFLIIMGVGKKIK